MQSYEVEIKSLLGSKENADQLRSKMFSIDPQTKLLSKNKQLNHYFIGGDLKKLLEATKPYLSSSAQEKLQDLSNKAKEFSVRTRDKDGTVLLVVKASVGDDTSANGVKRIEFEEKMAMKLPELDNILLDSGFSYQAKWSREREEYSFKGATVALDKNAGYGYLAEFEKVVQSEHELDEAREEMAQLMRECGVEELPQSRLERMFKFYNEHWQDYYGTEKIFTVK